MNVKGLDLDKIASLLTAVVDGEQNLSDAKIRSLIVSAYNNLTQQYAPIIRAIPAVAGPLAKDLTPVICALLDLCSTISESALFKVSHKKFAKARATVRMTSLKAYTDAGFSGPEAFQLVLRDAANKMQMPNMSSSSSTE